MRDLSFQGSDIRDPIHMDDENSGSFSGFQAEPNQEDFKGMHISPEFSPENFAFNIKVDSFKNRREIQVHVLRKKRNICSFNIKI